MILRKVLLLAVVVLALGASGAQANNDRPLLTGPTARSALTRWSLTNGMVKAETRQCIRMRRDRIRCVAIETGQWGNEGVWATDVHSWYLLTLLRDRQVEIQWIDFEYGPPVES